MHRVSTSWKLHRRWLAVPLTSISSFQSTSPYLFVNLEMFKRSDSRYHSPFSYDEKNYAIGRRDGPAGGLLLFTPRHGGPVRFCRAKRSRQIDHRATARRRISNRKYFAIFPLKPPHLPAFAPSRPTNSNSNIHTIRISTNPRNITTYAFSNRNKINLSPFASAPAFLLAKARPAI